MSDAFVQTTQLTKQYGSRTAVNQINLELNKQDIYGFLGPNGAGKTTTIRMLLGLIRPTSGSIRMFGKSFPKSRIDVLKKVGSLVESPSYYGHLNACENLETIRRIIDVPVSRIDEVLSIVGLTKDAKRVVKGYSLGMRQRLGIAAALLGSPELLILDEPTNGLDPAGILEMRELIKSLPAQYGITVLVSSHLLSEIEQMANRVGIIQHGSILFQDSLEMLQKQAKHHISLAVSDPRQAAHTISTWGIHAAEEEDLLTITYVPDEQVALIVQQLVQNGHSIYRIVDQRQSLEEIFLSLTGKERS
ncbi:ABC transporter ATP-binding protein [Paenibacillus sp. UMB4589-SE434]|uniref:ABC transporter ATP-binding protein n=1 Tax=Paenibacillus sp. UMB4589-SE434 TaxID=3046314 RepID=UPI00255184EF|nr:ABC transporter ATP-binding protein [Paenibacillus sp. UMB4589-SE434]MDK8183158.1 ABC transporter ATP-binding protein [Paenibacillus sp. UMB4589-SE434]